MAQSGTGPGGNENKSLSVTGQDSELDAQSKNEGLEEQSEESKNPDESGEDGSEKDADAKKKKEFSAKDAVKAGQTAVSAGQAAAQVGKLMQLLMWLKSMGQMAMNLVSAAGNAFWGMLQGAWSAVTGFFSGAVSTVSSFFAIGAAAATTVVVGTSGIIGILLIGVVVTVSGALGSNRVDDTPDCRQEVKKLIVQENVDASTQKMVNAKLVYSVLHELGLADENIAGCLGNWEVESGIDPTSVETIFSEPYCIGPRKQAAWDAGFRIEAIDSDYANRFPLIKLAGLGLGGFTDTNDGAVNNTRLMAFAEALGREWHELDVQLAFCLCPADKGGFGKLFLNWPDEPNPRDAAYTFARDWEGNTTLHQEERKSSAERWFVTMAGWDADVNYANSIIEMAGSVSISGSDKAAKKAMDECHGADMNYDNSTLVNAALSLAWPTREQAHANDGTALYQALHRQILPGDGIFQSCDRSVCVAVRWSGVDDDFPPGGCTSGLIPHLSTSPKWEEIHWNGDKSKLQPGDILITPDHVCMYIGAEETKKKFPDDDGREIYEGSINYDNFSQGFSPHMNYCGGRSEYRAFRSVYKEPNPKYKHLSASSG